MTFKINNFGNQKMSAGAKSSKYSSMVVGSKLTVVNVRLFLTSQETYFPIKLRPLQIKMRTKLCLSNSIRG